MYVSVWFAPHEQSPPLQGADVNLVRVGRLSITVFHNSPPIKTEAFYSSSPLAIFIPFNHFYSLQLVRLEWKQLVTVSSVS